LKNESVNLAISGKDFNFKKSWSSNPEGSTSNEKSGVPCRDYEKKEDRRYDKNQSFKTNYVTNYV
jgi:hypothetical protein